MLKKKVEMNLATFIILVLLALCGVYSAWFN